MTKIKYEDITDQQYADIIAHFVKRRMVGKINEIIIHAGKYDIHIKTQSNIELSNISDDAIWIPSCCTIF